MVRTQHSSETSSSEERRKPENLEGDESIQNWARDAFLYVFSYDYEGPSLLCTIIGVDFISVSAKLNIEITFQKMFFVIFD